MKLVNIVVTIIMLISLIQTVSAAGIGVSPSELKFEDALKGSAYEKDIKIDNTGDDDIIAEIDIIDHKEWFTLDESVKVPAKSSAKVKVMISIPEDTENGEYETMVYVKGRPADAAEGMGLIPGAGFKAKISVTDQEIIKGYVDNILTRDATFGSNVKFIVGFLNQGNVQADPLAKITIKTETDDFVADFEKQFEAVKAGAGESLIAEYSTKGLDLGKYKADVGVYLNDELLKEKTVYFRISEEILSAAEEETEKDIVVIKEETQKKAGSNLITKAVESDKAIAGINIVWIIAAILVLGIGIGLGVGISNVFFKRK